RPAWRGRRARPTALSWPWPVALPLFRAVRFLDRPVLSREAAALFSTGDEATAGPRRRSAREARQQPPGWRLAHTGGTVPLRVPLPLSPSPYAESFRPALPCHPGGGRTRPRWDHRLKCRAAYS